MEVSTDQISSVSPSALGQSSLTDSISGTLSKVADGVSLRSVTKLYGSVTAIENLTLDIPSGQYCCLLGPSGCGKTTALRLISGHESVTRGKVLIGDRCVNDLPPAKRNTAMMFQNYALFPHKTVWQNVEFGLKMQQVPKRDRRLRVGEMLELVGLSHTADRKPHALSGGQQQRIALARALVTRPHVLMLDEPLSALDENLRVRMRGELRKIQKQFGLTFIQVTHHVEEAFSLSDQIVVMNQGHIEQVSTPSELFNTPASQFVAKFMGENNIFQGKVVRCGESVGINSVGSNLVGHSSIGHSSIGHNSVEHNKERAHRRQDSNNMIIELDVEGIGAVFCRGYPTQPGTPATCSVRPDLLTVIPRSGASSPKDVTSIDDGRTALTARVVDVELTGYVTRVSLVVDPTGQELLYKVRTQDWIATHLQETHQVTVTWSANDCVFLPN